MVDVPPKEMEANQQGPVEPVQGPPQKEGWMVAWRRRVEGLRQEAFTLYLACRDPRCPWYAKLLAAAVVAYALSPIDLIPDFIPVLGLLDDLILVPLGVLLVRRLVPAEVLEDCRVRAKEAIGRGRPVSWAGAAVILCVWAGLAALAFLAVRRWLWG